MRKDQVLLRRCNLTQYDGREVSEHDTNTESRHRTREHRDCILIGHTYYQDHFSLHSMITCILIIKLHVGGHVLVCCTNPGS